MPEPLTWSTAQVAAALGFSVRWFYQHGRALRAQGFPAPLPIIRRYDPAAVRAWIARRDGTPEAPPADEGDVWATELDRRAAILGARCHAA